MPSGPRIRVNNVYGTLSAFLDDDVAATVMNSAGLALLPEITGAHAIIVLDPKREFGQPEIVAVTEHVGLATSATITRAAYGTIKREHQSGTDWAHITVDEDYVEVLTSITRPLDPYQGQTIFEMDTQSFRNFTTAGWNSSPPVGTLLAYAGAVAPDGYLMANGAAVTRTGATASLFGVIGTTYGVGDGVNTFNLPNLNGKVPVGRDATQAEFDVLGEVGGAKTVTLTQGQMPQHLHGVTDNSHNHGQTTHTHGNDQHEHGATSDDNEAGGHVHTASTTGNADWGVRFAWAANGLVGNPAERMSFTSMNSAGAHNHNIWTDVHHAGINIHGNYAWIQGATTGITINNTGSNEAHTNLQPYITVNYIIKI